MDYYQILGVDKSASPEQIKKAYRKLASQHHPDKGGDNAKFQEIQVAYSTLSDPQKRAEYDNPQTQFSHHFGGFNGMDPNDIFAHMFGGGVHFGNGFRRQQVRRNKNVNINVQMSLNEVLTGKEIVGSIKLPSGKDQAIQITIPPGVETGDTIKYPGLGDDSIPNLPKGDLLVQIHEAPDPRFVRQGNKLITEQSISVFDAILGCKVKITTIDNSVIELTIPPGTKPDTVFSCSGYGLPHKNSKIRGNLYVKAIVTVPNNLDDQDKSVLENMRKKYNA